MLNVIVISEKGGIALLFSFLLVLYFYVTELKVSRPAESTQ